MVKTVRVVNVVSDVVLCSWERIVSLHPGYWEIGQGVGTDTEACPITRLRSVKVVRRENRKRGRSVPQGKANHAI